MKSTYIKFPFLCLTSIHSMLFPVNFHPFKSNYSVGRYTSTLPIHQIYLHQIYLHQIYLHQIYLLQISISLSSIHSMLFPFNFQPFKSIYNYLRLHLVRRLFRVFKLTYQVGTHLTHNCSSQILHSVFISATRFCKISPLGQKV